MSKKLKHVIGTNSQIQFKIYSVAFDGTRSVKNLSNSKCYFELERDGVKLLGKDSDLVGGADIVDAANGICVACIDDTDLTAADAGTVKYGLLVHDDPGGSGNYKSEAARGCIDLIADLVSTP